jgi:hypothetical protein
VINEFIAHLKANVTPDVRFALTTEPVENYDDELPVILVYPNDYAAEKSAADNMVVQSVDYNIACLVGCHIDDYEEVLQDLQQAAIGWVDGYSDAVELVGGAIEGIKGGYIWWKEMYTTRIQIRQSL